MIVPSKFNGYNRDGTRNLFMNGGGSGGGTTNTTSTVTNSNVPAYAEPYVNTMLGATQNQLFNTSQVQTGTDDAGAAIMGTQLDSFKPYQAYGGTYDATGKQTAYDPTKGIAGFTPDQLAAQKGIMGLSVPGQFDVAGQAIGSIYNDAKTNAYTAPQNLGYTADEAKAAGTLMTTSANNVGYGSTDAKVTDAGTTGLGYTTDKAGTTGLGYTADKATSQGYTSTDAAKIAATAATLGDVPVAKAANLGATGDISRDKVSSGEPLTAYQMKAAQSTYDPGLQQYSMTSAPSVATKSFTDAGTAASYMSPYTQGVTDIQTREAQRNADIAATQRHAEATKQGAFGGSRGAIMDAEAARNLAIQKGDITAQGQQAAYQQAQAQFNAEQGYGLQGQIANQQAGLTVGQQNLGAQLGIQQLGAQTGTQIALANLSNDQQAAVQNQASQLQAQGMSSAQALQAALANQSTGLQAAQANQQTQYNTAAQNAQMQQQTALANQALSGQYGLTQGQMQQAANMQTSAQAQQAALQNAAQSTAASQFGSAASNQAQLANAAAANQAAQFGAGASNQAQLANQAAANQALQFGAGASNQAQLANAAAANQLAAQNAAQATAASQFGAGATNQAYLANAAAANQAEQYNAGLKQQTALANQAAANQASQFGAAQGLTSAQTEAQYGLAGGNLQLQAAGALGTLGQQQLAAQQGILGLQNQVGAQQQAQDQAAKNQAIQDYANAQQYPLMQLGTMSNMLRGLPMQASTTNQYAASPNPLSQAVGTVGAGASIYNAMKPAGAAGGLPSQFKYSSGGGIKSFDVGGEVESQLENMDDTQLQEQLKSSSSPSIRRMAQRLLREHQMAKQPQGTGPMGVQYQAPGMYGGGAVAFAKGNTVYGGPSTEEGGEEEAKIGMTERLAQPPGGIMAAVPPTPAANPPFARTQPGGVVTSDMAAAQDRLIEQQGRLQTSSNRPLAEFVAEREALMGPNTGNINARAEEMARRASTKDEQDRQKSMRMAEFFAKWGSTPGPVLVAGMNALKESIPNMIADQKDAKKLQRESDKIIYDLDQATRLEKQGYTKEAVAEKNEIAKRAEDISKTLANLYDHQMTAQAHITSSQNQARAHVEGAGIQAKAHVEGAKTAAEASNYASDARAKEHRASSAQRADEIAYGKVQNAADNAYKTLNLVQQNIAAMREKSGSAYNKAQEDIALYKSQLANYDGDPSKVNPIIKSKYAEALGVVNAFNTDAQERIDVATKRYADADLNVQNYGRAAKDRVKAPTTAPSDSNPLGLTIKPPPAVSGTAPALLSKLSQSAAPTPNLNAAGDAKTAAEAEKFAKSRAASKGAYQYEVQNIKDKIGRGQNLNNAERNIAQRAGLFE